MSRPMRIAMMAMTTSNSINVNASRGVGLLRGIGNLLVQLRGELVGCGTISGRGAYLMLFRGPTTCRTSVLEVTRFASVSKKKPEFLRTERSLMPGFPH